MTRGSQITSCFVLLCVTLSHVCACACVRVRWIGQLPAPATASAVDPLETLLFVGGGDGVVYQVDLHGAAAAKAAPAVYAGGSLSLLA